MIRVASVVHRGSMETIVPTYEALVRSIEDSGYRMTGRSRETQCVIIANPSRLATSLTCNDDGIYTLTLKADDGVTTQATATTTVTVADAVPVVGPLLGRHAI